MKAQSAGSPQPVPTFSLSPRKRRMRGSVVDARICATFSRTRARKRSGRPDGAPSALDLRLLLEMTRVVRKAWSI